MKGWVTIPTTDASRSSVVAMKRGRDGYSTRLRAAKAWRSRNRGATRLNKVRETVTRGTPEQAPADCLCTLRWFRRAAAGGLTPCTASVDPVYLSGRATRRGAGLVGPVVRTACCCHRPAQAGAHEQVTEVCGEACVSASDGSRERCEIVTRRLLLRGADRNQRNSGVGWMPWRAVPMKGVAKQRNASGESLADCDPRIPEWGNPTGATLSRAAEHIRSAGAPGELKHLSTPRKRDHPRSSGERTGDSPNHHRVKAAAVAVLG